MPKEIKKKIKNWEKAKKLSKETGKIIYKAWDSQAMPKKEIEKVITNKPTKLCLKK